MQKDRKSSKGDKSGEEREEKKRKKEEAKLQKAAVLSELTTKKESKSKATSKDVKAPVSVDDAGPRPQRQKLARKGTVVRITFVSLLPAVSFLSGLNIRPHLLD